MAQIVSRKLPSQIVYDFVEQHIKITDGPNYGQPLILSDYQKKFIEAVLDPVDDRHSRRLVRTGILSIAKKNGKSFLAALFLLLFLIHPAFAIRNGKIYCAANSREQAKICFDDVCKFIRASPFLESLVEITESTNTIRVVAVGHPANGSVFKALAAQAGKQQGLKPHFAVLDEAGEAIKRDLYDVLKMGMANNADALMLAISTQSHDPNHFFSELVREGLNPDNPTVVTHLYAADQDCDFGDESQWFKANPMLGITIDLEIFRREMAELARSPSALNAARRYRLNQQVNLVGSLVSITDLQKCLPSPTPITQRAAQDFERGERIWPALDMSSKVDLTALCATGESGLVKGWGFKPEMLIDSGGIEDQKPYRAWAEAGWLIGTNGRSIDPKAVTDKLEDLYGRCEIVGMAYDRKKIDDVIRLLSDSVGCYLDGEFQQGIRLIKHDQGPRGMAVAIEALELAILNQTIKFDGSPLMTSHLSFAEVKADDSGNRWFIKPQGKGVMRIDLAVAAAMSVNIWSKSDRDIAKRIYDPFEDPDFKIMVI